MTKSSHRFWKCKRNSKHQLAYQKFVFWIDHNPIAPPTSLLVHKCMWNKLERQLSCNRTQYLLQSFHIADETLAANILAIKLYTKISHLKELEGVMAGMMGNIQKTIQVPTSLTLYWHIQPANNNHINFIQISMATLEWFTLLFLSDMLTKSDYSRQLRWSTLLYTWEFQNKHSICHSRSTGYCYCASWWMFAYYIHVKIGAAVNSHR